MAGRATVLHGVDQSVPNHDKLPSRGNWASVCMQENLKSRWLWDDEDEIWKPLEYIIAEYDFAVHGGAIGFIDLDVVVPAGTIIVDGMIDVLEEFSSAGAATIALKAEAADDILAAVAITTAGILGFKDVVPANSAATAIKLTTNKSIKIDIRVAAVTAGKLHVFLHCFRGEVATGDEWSTSSSTSVSTSSSSTSQTNTSSSTSLLESSSTTNTSGQSTSSSSVTNTSSSSSSSSSNEPA